MKPSRISPSARVSLQTYPGHGIALRPRQAFTLVEILVAMSILALIVTALASILSSTSLSCNMGRQRTNNATKARCMLDALSRDLRSAVLRSDLLAFSNSKFQFYTQQAGVTAGNVRQLSLVSYSIDTGSSKSTLQRGDAGITWDSSSQAIRFSDGQPSNLPGVVQRDAVDGVVGFEVVFYYSNGSVTNQYSPTADNTLRAVSINLAVIDDASLKVLNSDQIRSIRTQLTSLAQGRTDIKSCWDNYLNQQFEWSKYPKTLGSGLKTYERYVTLLTTVL